MGVVNNRIDIDALERASGGGGGGGEMTVDELWTGDLTNAYLDITESLAHPISDYKFLATCRVGGSSAESSQLLYVSKIGSGNNVIGTAGTSIQVKIDSGAFSIKAQTSLTGVTLLGIK